MKLLSFPLPGFNGVFRGLGRADDAVEAEVAEDGGGEGRVGWRKPPGPGRSDADVMEKCGLM